MSKYKFLCPKCGHAFLEGTSFHKCPQCQVSLLTAGSESATDHPATNESILDFTGLPDHVDIDELMRTALADQQPGEKIDAALNRAVAHKYPKAQAALTKLLARQLDTWQQFRGITRQQAAEQLAHAHSEMNFRVVGKPQISTSVETSSVTSSVNISESNSVQGVESIQGLDKLPPEQQELIRRQIVDAVKSGKPIPKIMFTTTSNQSATGWVWAALATVLFVIAFFVFHKSK